MADEDYLKEFNDKMKEYGNNPLGTLSNEIGRAISDLDKLGGGINRVFGETRQRIGDIKTALADATPGIDRLGGSILDTQQAIQDIALSTKRNVIATTEQTDKLYAAFKVTGVEIRTIVDEFSNVGVGLGQMTKQIETSINYIQSLGANTKDVFKVVTNNMDQLNRYQFEGGIQGLTKMAAQASLLRFDMRTTFNLSEDLYKPERAVQVAAAFQRLGLAVGDLGDPFRLMSDSINDPQGLQDSLVQMSKQFAYFDNQTKTFKINQEGVLRLKELGSELSIDSKELIKMGLAAKEADARISAISSVGLNVKEEDKQLLSNISRMGDGGEYEISIKDSQTGERRWEKLTNVNQEQLEATLEEQKKAPKDLESIARSQLDYTEMVAGDVRAIYHGFMYGFGSKQGITREVEGGRRLTDAIGGELSKIFGTTKYGRGLANSGAEDIKQFFKDVRDPKKGSIEAMATLAEKVDKQTQSLGPSFKEGILEFLNKIGDKSSGDSQIEKGTRQFIDGLLGDKRTPNASIDKSSPALLNNLMGRTDPIDISRKGINQPTNEVIYVKHSFDNPLEHKITGDKDKLDNKEMTLQMNKAMAASMAELGRQMLNEPWKQNPTKGSPVRGNVPFVYTPTNTSV
jgi:hypothetical protein